MSTSGEALQRGSGILMPGAHSNAKHSMQQQQPDEVPLPMKNNLILQRQRAAIYAFQQRVVEENLRQPASECAALAQTAAALQVNSVPAPHCDEDDASLPSTRYAHMSDTLQPERDEKHFAQWCRDMQTETDSLRERVAKELKQREQEQNRLWDERRKARAAQQKQR